MTQIPGFLPLSTPWPEFDENSINQYAQWLNAFADYLTKNVNLFSHQPVRFFLLLCFQCLTWLSFCRIIFRHYSKLF